MTISDLKEQYEVRLAKLRAENDALKFELERLKKIVLGSKRERFKGAQDPKQGNLFDPDAPLQPNEAQAAQVTEEEKPEAKASKAKSKPSKRRKYNKFPERFRRDEELLQPDNYENLQYIGEDIKEILVYKPMELSVKVIRRPKYKDPQTKTIHQVAMPPRLIERGLVDESFVAGLVVEKFEYHMPMYRFVKKLRQQDLRWLTADYCYNYLNKAAEAISPIWDALVAEMLQSNYLMMDESSIRVLEKNKDNSEQKGCMWVQYAPIQKLVCFHYRSTKEKKEAIDILNGYHGNLQTDGNKTYESIVKLNESANASIRIRDHLLCWAHARRKFFEAQKLAPDLIHPVLQYIQALYAIEREGKDLEVDQRRRLRQQKAVPILDELEQHINKAILKDLTGPVKQAFGYAHARFSALRRYTENGYYCIDTNLLENKIRPLALGRKNYLFADNHTTAQYIAIYYSLIATCQLHGIDTLKYFTWLFKQVASQKVSADWLPHRIDPAVLEL